MLYLVAVKLNKILALIVRIIRRSHYERTILRPSYILGEFYEIIRGRILARMVGFGGSWLGSGAKIIGSKAMRVESGASIKRNSWIEAIYFYGDQKFTPEIKIGKRFFASERLHISAVNSIVIGDDCLFGSGVYVGDHNHGSYKGLSQSEPGESPISRRLVSAGPVMIGSNVWFGDNVVVIGPATIGSGVVIGANSVVSGDVPEGVVACGAPLKIIRKFDANSKIWERVR